MNDLKTLVDLVYSADRDYGDEIFLREYVHKQFRETSFHEFRLRSDSLAVWINEHFDHRTHIALVGATSLEYLTAWFGVQCSGNVSVPIDTTNYIDNIADEIDRSDSGAVFLDDKHIKDISPRSSISYTLTKSMMIC